MEKKTLSKSLRHKFDEFDNSRVDRIFDYRNTLDNVRFSFPDDSVTAVSDRVRRFKNMFTDNTRPTGDGVSVINCSYCFPFLVSRILIHIYSCDSTDNDWISILINGFLLFIDYTYPMIRFEKLSNDTHHCQFVWHTVLDAWKNTWRSAQWSFRSENMCVWY